MAGLGPVYSEGVPVAARFLTPTTTEAAFAEATLFLETNVADSAKTAAKIDFG